MGDFEIVVGSQYLRNLAGSTRRTADDLRTFASLTACRLTSAPEVERAYEELSNKWDERREKLAKALETIASSFDTAREEFEKVDSDLASKLQVD
jgi:hypothetical protein